jgi:hypothetical protein
MSDLDNESKDSILDEVLNEVAQDRDELMLKMHLFKAEAKDEWEKTEKKWHHLKGNANHVSHEASEASKDTYAALQLLGQEIINSYKRIVKSL